MNKIEKKIKKEGREVFMLRSEKEAMVKNIVGDFVKEGNTSPYLSIFSRSVAYRVVFAGLAVILITGVPLTYASQNSVPGNFLYGFEINVVESIQEKFHVSSESRSKYHTERLNERLSELEAVKDDPHAGEFVEPAIRKVKEHSNSKLAAIQETEDKPKSSPSPKKKENLDDRKKEIVDELVELLAITEASEEIINEINNKNTDDEALARVEDENPALATLSIESEKDDSVSDSISSVSGKLNELIEEYSENQEDQEGLLDLISEDIEDINSFQVNEDISSEFNSDVAEQLELVSDEIKQNNLVGALMITTDLKVEILKKRYLSNDEEISKEERLDEREKSNKEEEILKIEDGEIVEIEENI